ncbi:MAG: hypothetical protein M1818_008301 [Claussenomyces sp. TS43310]|nr:MAG: hypothetical protein M1818_008301 [Claussenomyces sp. TS43310]
MINTPASLALQMLRVALPRSCYAAAAENGKTVGCRSAFRTIRRHAHESGRASTVPKTATPTVSAARAFSTTRENKGRNRIYTPVRRADELATYILSSTSSRVPLITLWTASYCSTCRVVAPLLKRLVESGAGESADGNQVAYCEVEFDSPDIMDSGYGMRYMITSLPTLVSFDRGEVMTDTKVTSPERLKDEQWLREWVENEAKRRGGGTGGGGSGGGLFRGLFGQMK